MLQRNTVISHGRGALALAMICMIGGFSINVSAADFEYSGDTGPGFWSETAGWEECAGTASDARQTPINIRRARTNRHLEPLQLNLLATELSLINNGHVIEQEYHNGSNLILDDRVFDLLQFHFHTFSEHVVRGKRTAMEMHAVFKDEASGELAVIGTMFKIGRENQFIETLIEAGLPRNTGDVVEAPIEINLEDGLTNVASYYTYQGSLTTPPCSEIVTWLVLRKQATISKRQFKAFNEIMGNNFRPLQERNDRVVWKTRNHGHGDDDDND